MYLCLAQISFLWFKYIYIFLPLLLGWALAQSAKHNLRAFCLASNPVWRPVYVTPELRNINIHFRISLQLTCCSAAQCRTRSRKVRFEVFTAVKVILFFWVLAQCRLIGRCQRCLHLQGWRWRVYVSPKRRHLPTSLHGARTQRNNIRSRNVFDISLYRVAAPKYNSLKS
jgi:hypothetical protein